ncbi:MAG TPA: IPT/TIG domain-containing protein [Vicinamibacteria bacterium]|nr:IPT/TIG domain-containing protein [Vicinamibacteria bacterium]
MSDVPLRLASLMVLGGALHGKQLDLEDLVDEILIGSDPDCRLHVDMPGVSPIHARVWVDLEGAVLHDTHSPRGLYVNFERVEGKANLQDGDMIWLGPPQEPGSVMIQCHFEERRADGADTLPEVEEPVTSVEEPLTTVDEPLGVLPEPAAERAPSPSPAPGLDEFLIMEAPPVPPAPPAPPAETEFVVSGFEAEWPEVRTGPAAPPPESAKHLAATAFVGGGGDDPFFVEDSPPPPEPPPAPADVGFFFDDSFPAPPAGEKKPAAPAEPAPAPSDPVVGESLSFESEEVFFGELAEPAPLSPAQEEPWAPAAPAPPVPAPASPPPGPAPNQPVLPTKTAPEPRPEAPPAPPARPASPPRPPAPVAPPARPTPRRETPPPAARAERPLPPRGRAKPAGGGSKLAGLAAVALLVVAGGGFLAWRQYGAARLDAVEPTRVRVGQAVVLRGKHFSPELRGNEVLFGDRAGTVVKAAEDRLEVEVPEVTAAAGQDVRLPVRVRAGSGESQPIEISIYQGPTLHGISPDVAMPGEEVVVAGVGWGAGPAVRFGALPAEVLDTKETAIRVRVPPVPGGPGTSAPVVVVMGAAESNPAPFFVGHVPLVIQAEPRTVAPGDLVVLSGRSFQRDRARNNVQIGGARALVLTASDAELKVVVPRLAGGGGERVLEVRVPGSEYVGRITLTAAPAPEVVDLHFVAEPFDGAPGRDHAVLATGLGPAFVLAASGGRSAAERAVEAERRLNDAASSIKASRDMTFEVRQQDAGPALALAGRPELLLEVTEEDAAAYNEDWTGLKGRGGAVSPARLARWWEAVARDLVLMLVRGEKPQHAATLAPEGRVLQEIFQAAQKTGRAGISAQVTTRPALRDGLRIVAYRVPPSVVGPAGGVAPNAAPSAAGPPPLQLEGSWVGTETEGGIPRYVTAVFRKDTGNLSFEGTVTLTVPLISLEQPQKDSVRYSLMVRGGMRYYVGKWDGQTVTGRIFTDAEGKEPVGTFSLRPR